MDDVREGNDFKQTPTKGDNFYCTKCSTWLMRATKDIEHGTPLNDDAFNSVWNTEKPTICPKCGRWISEDEINDVRNWE